MKTPVMIRPIIASIGAPDVISPRLTRVASFFTMTPAFCKPMNAMKRPIPAPIAFLRLAGIALTIASRRLVSVSITNIRPSIRIAVRANCQEWPRPQHPVNTKNALSPIPGARAKGSFAHNDIIRVPVMAASAVAIKEIEEIKKGVENGTMHPKKVKENLASEIVDRFHGVGAGALAKAEFEKVFAKKDIPTDIPEFIFEGEIWICQAMLDSKLVDSTSQARRDINSNAVSINQEKISDNKLNITSGEYILQKGKKSFAKIIIK